MGFFSTLLGMGSSKNKAIIDQLNVMDAINAHIHWKIRLEKYLNGSSDEKLDPEVICLDDQCTLGQWIYGPAQELFLLDEGYEILRQDHAQFHVIASRVVIKVQEKDTVAARELLKGEYSQASRKVVHDLTELSKQLSE